MDPFHSLHKLQNPQPLLTAREVATRMSISLRTVDIIVAEGGLVPIRVRPRVRRFDPVQVEAYLRLHSKDR